jgi:phytoene dehydrogenase-like protein
MYAGVSPQQALALYAVIAYMDSVNGVFFPKGGMHAVPRALAGAAEKHGVTFKYNTTVTSVEHSNGRATAVLTENGERIEGDAFILNPDLFSWTATIPQSLTKVQRSGVFKEHPNGDMSFANFHFFASAPPFGVPHPLLRSADERASLHTFNWEYFDSGLRVFEWF